MNVLQLDFPSNHFHFIYDKGTLDSILCGDDAERAGTKAVSEISRVLHPGGIFVTVSHAPPEYREALFKAPQDQFIHYQFTSLLKPKPLESLDINGRRSAESDPAQEEVVYVYVVV
jgi:ubiquinone/menaquinone biosynthesis C-methylase UbiE